MQDVMAPNSKTCPVIIKDAQEHCRKDFVIVEEPLEIRVASEDGQHEPYTVTMRTPGNDFELVIGHLFCEEIITQRHDVIKIEHCGLIEGHQTSNVIKATLSNTSFTRLKSRKRSETMSSSCGLCGKTSLESIPKVVPRPHYYMRWEIDQLLKVVSDFQQMPSLFEETGASHACALYSGQEKLLVFAEDVGRHNAMDKLVGHVLDSGLELDETCLLVLSGRVSYEMIQKAGMLAVANIVAVGAPTHLAIEMCRYAKINLYGFCKKTTVNVYAYEDGSNS